MNSYGREGRKVKERKKEEEKKKEDKKAGFEEELKKEISEETIRKLALKILEKEKGKDLSPAKKVLNLVATGVFLFFQNSPRNVMRRLSPYIKDPETMLTKRPWKAFNIPYLKRQISRLEKQKLVEIWEDKEKTVIKITKKGKIRFLRFAIESLEIEKPAKWDGKWRLVIYDLPEDLRKYRVYLRKLFIKWGFYPLQKSVYLHAYPCDEQIEFLREYFKAGKYIKLLEVVKLENEEVFKEFFNLS